MSNKPSMLNRLSAKFPKRDTAVEPSYGQNRPASPRGKVFAVVSARKEKFSEQIQNLKENLPRNAKIVKRKSVEFTKNFKSNIRANLRPRNTNMSGSQNEPKVIHASNSFSAVNTKNLPRSNSFNSFSDYYPYKLAPEVSKNSSNFSNSNSSDQTVHSLSKNNIYVEKTVNNKAIYINLASKKQYSYKPVHAVIISDTEVLDIGAFAPREPEIPPIPIEKDTNLLNLLKEIGVGDVDRKLMILQGQGVNSSNLAHLSEHDLHICGFNISEKLMFDNFFQEEKTSEIDEEEFWDNSSFANFDAVNQKIETQPETEINLDNITTRLEEKINQIIEEKIKLKEQSQTSNADRIRRLRRLAKSEIESKPKDVVQNPPKRDFSFLNEEEEIDEAVDFSFLNKEVFELDSIESDSPQDVILEDIELLEKERIILEQEILILENMEVKHCMEDMVKHIECVN